MRAYRILHQKCDGLRPVLLFQNRIVKAQSAEQALRLAIRFRASELEIDVRSDEFALARPHGSTNLFDGWTAEYDPLASASA